MTAMAMRQQASAGLGATYIQALALGLAGYATFGKGFAYLGASPLYVGEVLLALGLLALMQSRCLLSVFTSTPNLMLAVICAWVLARTVPLVGTYGIDALRDSVIVTYGAFAVIACALLVERPERLNAVFRHYARFAAFYGPCAWMLYFASKLVRDAGLVLPGTDQSIMSIRAGEVAVHIAGSAIFAMLFFPRTSLASRFSLVLSIGFVAAQSRGGMLAMLLPLGIAAMCTGRFLQILRMACVFVALLGATHLAGFELAFGNDNRVISAEQMVMNAASIFGGGNEGDLDGTKAWRLAWWQAIRNYTIDGPLFWTGHGFGMSLAEEDGFVVGLEHGGPVVRSPHNANMTILARAGVPGLVLWLLLLADWFVTLSLSMLEAHLRDEGRWAKFFLFLMCYLIAILVNASFDVALEGPMLGIWFWTLFGIGTGSAMIYRAQGGRR